MQRYRICGRDYAPDGPGFAAAVAQAYAQQHRPRCLCRPDGLEMYISRVDQGFLVKRMPGSGAAHEPNCCSFETLVRTHRPSERRPPIAHDPETGTTVLRPAFALLAGASVGEVTQDRGSHRTGQFPEPPGLSLRELLDYLWHEAELDQWHPSFEGRRNWATVRRRVLRCAQGKMLGRWPLSDLLYMPEPFSALERAAIRQRRLQAWGRFDHLPRAKRPMLILIGELKALTSRSGRTVVTVRHVPDAQLFASMEAASTLQLAEKRNSAERDSGHLMAISTLLKNEAGCPCLREAELMHLSGQWR